MAAAVQASRPQAIALVEVASAVEATASVEAHPLTAASAAVADSMAVEAEASTAADIANPSHKNNKGLEQSSPFSLTANLPIC